MKNIIMILVAVIVVLAAAIGFAFLNPTDAKAQSKINITSDDEQFEGGELSIELTDLNNTPISKQSLNVSLTNGSGETVVDEVVTTDSQGSAKLDLNLSEGNYTVTVNYGGNDNYTGNNTTQDLTIMSEAETSPEPIENSYSDYAEEEIDYNSPDSEYYRWDTDGSYHKKQEGGNYIYAQDAYTGEWSYWANKT